MECKGHTDFPGNIHVEESLFQKYSQGEKHYIRANQNIPGSIKRLELLEFDNNTKEFEIFFAFKKPHHSMVYRIYMSHDLRRARKVFTSAKSKFQQ